MTFRFDAARLNSSLVPCTHGANVLSEPSARLCTLVLRQNAIAFCPAHSGERQRERVKGTSSLVGTGQSPVHLFTIQTIRTLSQTPVACNTGVTEPPMNRLLASQVDTKQPMKKITKHVDYLGMTYPDGTKPDETGLNLTWRKMERAFKGYQFALINDETGAIFLYNVARTNMGAHLQLSGSALSQLRLNLKVDDYSLIRQLTDWQGRASRLDLAINFHDCAITPQKAFAAFENGTIKTPARSAKFIEGIEDHINGKTCYIGVRESERFVRIYDKNAEQKNKAKNPEAWIRMELELKKLWAKAAQNSIVQYGTEAAVNSHFSDFVGWSNREYNEALTGESAPIDEQGRREGNTEKWLIRQCIPALARACRDNPSFYHTFVSAYQKARNDLEERGNTL